MNTMSSTSERTAGMIGLGIMGSAMSANLIAAGFTVIGHDVVPQAMDAFAAAGGRKARSAAAVADAASIIITSLPSAKALHDVAAEIAAKRRDGTVLAETSTLSLDDKLAAQKTLAAGGVTMLDCPLSGSGSQAKVRDVLVYASGPKDAYERCLPVFQGFSRAPHHVGEFGNGSKMKFIANHLVAIHTAAAGEAFALARKAGLDPAQTFALVSDGAGGSRALQVRGEMLIADRYLPVRTMPLDLWRKDLRVITDFAAEVSCPTPLFAACVPLFQAAIAAGLGAEDTAAVCAASEALAGLKRAAS
jgi:putative dehydrogenase